MLGYMLGSVTWLGAGMHAGSLNVFMQQYEVCVKVKRSSIVTPAICVRSPCLVATSRRVKGSMDHPVHVSVSCGCSKLC